MTTLIVTYLAASAVFSLGFVAGAIFGTGKTLEKIQDEKFRQSLTERF